MGLRRWLHRGLVEWLKALVLILFVTGIVSVVQQVKPPADLLNLKSSLGSCGQAVSIQWPVVVAEPETVHLGQEVSLAAFVHVWGGGGVYIGNRVMIGAHTAIASRTHDYGQDIMYYTVVRKPVTIEDDVWIGSNCVILPGIHIGEGAVVGAGSVVTRDIDAKTVVAGVPARVVARRRERAVQGSEATRGD